MVLGAVSSSVRLEECLRRRGREWIEVEAAVVVVVSSLLLWVLPLTLLLPAAGPAPGASCMREDRSEVERLPIVRSVAMLRCSRIGASSVP